MQPAMYAAVKNVFRNCPPADVMTSNEPESTSANWFDGNTNCETYDKPKKISPHPTVAIMMALGTVRLGSLASSDIVDTASKPRNDRQRIAAPAKIGPAPPTVPSPVNGAIRLTLPTLLIVTKAITTKTTMKMICSARRRKLARATETMPTMLSTVTTTIAIRIHTHGGTAGIAAVM